jgi:hypothetical protein
MRHGLIIWLLSALIATPAAAQLLPGLGPLPGGLSGVVGGLTGPVAGPLGAVPAALPQPSEPLGIASFAAGVVIPDARNLLTARRERLRDMIRGSGKALFADPDGNPARQSEILVLDVDDASARALAAAGFEVLRDSRGADGVRVTILRPPEGMNVKQALRRLAETAPGIAADYNHVYEPAGGALRPIALAPVAGGGGGGTAIIGLVDGGVGAHAALAAASIEQRGFAGAVAATGHGTAIASLLVGRAPGFAGVAPAARLLVADVYGGSPANGSAESIAAGLDWLAQKGARVINISLVGPDNIALARSIAALRARGVLVVAAVGNDGPAAPPMYPASYPGVVAVTGIDARGRILAEAGRAAHVDFASPGADMAAALRGGGYAAVRGTSFAVPLVAAQLALHPGNALAAVTAEAVPAGKRMGHGIVCGGCRNDPAALVSKKSH